MGKMTVNIEKSIAALFTVCAFINMFVFPSLYEGMPNTVIEAQATGLPCVLSDTITKEADITGLVTYLPLDETADKWANVSIKKKRTNLKNVRKALIRSGYDIESVTKKFVKYLF